MRSVFAAIAIVLALGISPPPAHADSLVTVANEGFDYPVGDSGNGLSTLNGGSGWEGAWAFPYTPAEGTFQPLQFMTSNNLTYPGLVSAGGGASWWQRISVDPNGSGRLLPMLDSGIVYFQFLSSISNTSRGGGTPNIRLSTYDASTSNQVVTGGIGNNDGRSNMALLNASLQEVSGGVTNVNMNPAPNLSNLTIVRFDYNNQRTSVWMNPDLSTFDYLNPPSATVTVSSYAPVFNRIDIYFANNGIIDEIKIMRILTAEDAVTPASAKPARQTISLQTVEGVSCSSSSLSGTQGTWATLPAADQCRVTLDPEARVLGWATTPNFPVEIAQRQVDNGWGAYELFSSNGRLSAVFIPAGKETLLSGANNFYPIITNRQ